MTPGRSLPVLLCALAASCGSGAEEPLAAEEGGRWLVSPAFLHGAPPANGPAGYLFAARAGDVVAVDVWPAPGVEGAAAPSLVLRHRGGATLAEARPRDADPRHVAIDGFRVPVAGVYAVEVRGVPRFSLRFWSNASHAPRVESAQVELTAAPSPALLEALARHEAGAPWSDPEVRRLAAPLASGPLRTSLADAEELLARAGLASDQREEVRSAVRRRLDPRAPLRRIAPGDRAFALAHLAAPPLSLLGAAPAPLPAPAEDRLRWLVARWLGAHEDSALRRVLALRFGEAIAGYQLDFACSLADDDGQSVWVDFSREWFDPRGGWLGEQSAGASEPDD